MTEALTLSEESPGLVDLAQVVGRVGVGTNVTGTELLEDLRILEPVPMPGDPPATPGTNAGFQSA